MAAKKLLRDSVLLGHPLRLHLCSQPQASCSRLRLISAGGHSCNRRYSVFNEFSNKFKGEVSRTSFFSSSPKVSSTFQKLKEVKVADLAKRGYCIVRDESSGSPSKRRHMDHAPTTTSTVESSTGTGVVVLPSMQSMWEASTAKAKVSAAFQKPKKFRLIDFTSKRHGIVRGPFTEMWEASKEKFVDDVLERWETSDNPVLHEIENLNETIFQETETTTSMREIRRRDPFFSLPKFVAEVGEVVKPVLNAYIKGDVETLKKYCSFETVERCKAEHGANTNRGIFFDNKILDVSCVEVTEMKMMGTSPIINLSFRTNQLYCVRDQNGAITERGEMHTVLYDWAMQLVDPEKVGEGATATYPVWRLRAMRLVGVLAGNRVLI